MSTFAFTAPTISAEDERQERERLSAEVLKRYQEEVYGTEKQVVEEASTIRNGLLLLQEALEEIPPSEKRVYLEALERIPHLVQRESPGIAFLRYANYDAWVAARTLVGYWSARRDIFGDERAFQPMTLDGAMQPDVQFLEKAIVLILEDDAHGRAVFYLDRMRCTKEIVPRDSVVRCTWYASQTLIEEERYQKRGVVGIANYRAFDLYKHFDRIMTKKFIRCSEGLPTTLKAIHCCTGSGPSVTRDIVLPVMKQMLGLDVRLRLKLHTGSASEILHGFQDFGLGKVHVDAVFGGYNGNIPKVREWLEYRRVVESGHPRE